MDKKSATTAQSVLNGIMDRARAEAVQEDRKRAPSIGVNIQNWSGNAFICQAVPDHVLRTAMGQAGGAAGRAGT